MKHGTKNEPGDDSRPPVPLNSPDGANKTAPSAGPKTNAPILLEVICERKHCLLYDYAINTVDFVAEKFGERVNIKPVVRRGNVKNALRYLELCRKNRRPLSVPTILIDGEVVFTDMPTPKELEAAISAVLEGEPSKSQT